jgi:hypothetical protein
MDSEESNSNKISGFTEFQRRRVEELEKLKTNSKKLGEIIFNYEFDVGEVISEIYLNSASPASKLMDFEKYSIPKNTPIPKLTLSVFPKIESIPTRKLTFYGNSPVRAGDLISAQIPIYEQKIIRASFSELKRNPRASDKSFYLERDIQTEESAIEIIIHSIDGKELRRDRAVNYDFFFKK